MEFKILDFMYENTGGHCMVGFAQVWLPEENRTVFVNVNGEGCSFWPVDAFHGEIDDVTSFADISAMDSSGVDDKYFEVARECMRLFLHHDGPVELPYAWLPEAVKVQITEEYTEWLQENYYCEEPMYEVDDVHLYLDEGYQELVSMRNRQAANEKAAAVCAASERLGVINAFLNFRNAYQELVKRWEMNKDDVNDILVEHYPFDESFDELAIIPWCDDVINGLIGIIL